MDTLRVTLEGAEVAVMGAIKSFLAAGGGLVLSSGPALPTHALLPPGPVIDAPAVPKPRHRRAKPKPISKARPASKAKPPVKSPAPAASAVAQGAEYSGWKASILNQLAKKPMSTPELVAVLKPPSPGSVYDARYQLDKAGVIEARTDPADGIRKNYLKESK